MGAMQLHAVGAGLQGAARGLAEQIDDAGQFVIAQAAQRLAGLHAAVEAGVCRTARVPDLQLRAPAVRVHGVGDPAPSGHAGVVVDAGLAGEGAAVGRHRGGLGDQQAKLLKRAFEIDMECCTNCGGELQIIAAILEQPVIEKILTQLGLRARAPPRAPARGQVLQAA